MKSIKKYIKATKEGRMFIRFKDLLKSKEFFKILKQYKKSSLYKKSK